MIYFWLASLINLMIPLIYTEYSERVLLVSFILLIIPELKREKLLVALFTLYWYVYDIFVIVPTEQYIFEFIIFSVLLGLNIYTKEINYLPYNKDNICIAFYKGDNKSILARISSLFFLDVTSTDILYNGSLWRYKHGKLVEMPNFRDYEDYIFYDTGINKDISKTLLHISKTKYKKRWCFPNCTRILLPLLVELNIKPKGFNLIPSLYLRRLLSNG